MATTLGDIPDQQSLRNSLALILRRHGLADDRVTVVNRQPNVYSSTFPSEIVTCRLPDGDDLRLLCKYTAGRSHRAHGHRGDVAYEADVYRHVLEPLQVPTVRYYGAHVDAATGNTWLVLEDLEESLRVSRVPSSGRGAMTTAPDPMLQAACWIGRFHSVNEARISTSSLRFLNVHDADYYLSWARRTVKLSGHLCERFPWLRQVCIRFEEAVGALLSGPPTVIHGEYYPQNVLFRDGRIYPVDWESAAIAAGEIDLASMTEGWPEAMVRECVEAYQAVRWPDGAPKCFERVLWAARIYLHLRWLGDRAGIEQSAWRLGHLKMAGEQLGLV
jgi:hypothetical protein